MAMLNTVTLKNNDSTMIFTKRMIRQKWRDEKDTEIVDQTLIKFLDNASLNQTITLNGQEYKVATVGQGEAI